MKEFKSKYEDDLLTENFEARFDDDLEAIVGADFIGMVTIPPAEFEKETETENYYEDWSDVFPGQEWLFLGEDFNENVLFEKLDEVMRSHL